MNAYEKGRAAFHEGIRYGGNPYPPSQAARDWNIGWKTEDELSAERAKATEAANRLRNVVDAIEAFTDAKVRYALEYAKDTKWANLTDVNETREQLTDKLAELIAGEP
jgi:nuclear transport factor 2 (NTF2) superfamily protein